MRRPRKHIATEEKLSLLRTAHMVAGGAAYHESGKPYPCLPTTRTVERGGRAFEKNHFRPRYAPTALRGRWANLGPPVQFQSAFTWTTVSCEARYLPPKSTTISVCLYRRPRGRRCLRGQRAKSYTPSETSVSFAPRTFRTFWSVRNSMAELGASPETSASTTRLAGL